MDRSMWSDPRLWIGVIGAAAIVVAFLVGVSLGSGTPASEAQGLTHTALDAFGKVISSLQEKKVQVYFDIDGVESNPSPPLVKLHGVARFKSGTQLDIDLMAGAEKEGAKPIYSLRLYSRLHESTLPPNLKEQGPETRLAAWTLSQCANLQRTFRFGDPEQGAPVWGAVIASVVTALNDYEAEYARLQPKLVEANRLIIQAHDDRMQEARERELAAQRRETNLRSALDVMWSPPAPAPTNGGGKSTAGQPNGAAKSTVPTTASTVVPPQPVVEPTPPLGPRPVSRPATGST